MALARLWFIGKNEAFARSSRPDVSTVASAIPLYLLLHQLGLLNSRTGLASVMRRRPSLRDLPATAAFESIPVDLEGPRW